MVVENKDKEKFSNMNTKRHNHEKYKPINLISLCPFLIVNFSLLSKKLVIKNLGCSGVDVSIFVKFYFKAILNECDNLNF